MSRESLPRPIMYTRPEQAELLIKHIRDFTDFVHDFKLHWEEDAEQHQAAVDFIARHQGGRRTDRRDHQFLRIHLIPTDAVEFGTFYHLDRNLASFVGYPLNLHHLLPKREDMIQAVGIPGLPVETEGFSALPCVRFSLDGQEWRLTLPSERNGWMFRLGFLRDEAAKIYYAERTEPAPTTPRPTADGPFQDRAAFGLWFGGHPYPFESQVAFRLVREMWPPEDGKELPTRFLMPRCSDPAKPALHEKWTANTASKANNELAKIQRFGFELGAENERSGREGRVWWERLPAPKIQSAGPEMS